MCSSRNKKNIDTFMLKKKAPYQELWINTLQPLCKTVRYNTVLDITRFKDGSQKCIDYIEKWSFFNIIFTFLFAMDPKNSVIKRLWCIFFNYTNIFSYFEMLFHSQFFSQKFSNVFKIVFIFFILRYLTSMFKITRPFPLLPLTIRYQFTH